MKLNPICKYSYIFILTISFAFIFITTPLWAKEFKIPKVPKELKLTANVDAFLTYSFLQGDDSLLGGSFNALLAPHYKINEKTLFIFMYDVNYYRKREYYSDTSETHMEDTTGSKERIQFQSHDFTPMVRLKIGDGSRYTLTPSCFYTATYNIDVENEGWGDGWYNYRDMGLGLDFTDKRLRYYKLNGILKLGIQLYQRHFPNFPSLREEDEKDYTGIITSMEYQHKDTANISWSTEYDLLYKMLKNKMVDDENGNPTGDKQRDYMHHLNLSIEYTYSPDIRIGADINIELYRSNQNNFSGEFISNFYSYNSYGLTPNISYTFETRPIIIELSYAYQKTNYSDRIAKDSNQVIKAGETQWETHNEILLKAGYEINKNWQAIGKLQRIVVDSNNEDESIYKYNYKDTSFSVGFSYRY